MCLRRGLSIGLAAMLLACGVGVSGLESVGLKPATQEGAVEPPVLNASSSEEGGSTLADGPADATGPLPMRGLANSREAGVGAVGNPAPDLADGAADSAGLLVDAEVVALGAIGCPNRAACPADQVCCALFEDGGYIPAFDDAGALETSCRPSCTAGTTPLCATNADCGDADVCYNTPSYYPAGIRGFCVPSFYPRFPTGDP